MPSDSGRLRPSDLWPGALTLELNGQNLMFIVLVQFLGYDFYIASKQGSGYKEIDFI